MSLPHDLPEWLRPLVDAMVSVRREQLGLPPPRQPGARCSAVLVLFGDRPGAAGGRPDLGDVLLIERAHTMRSHAAQMAFPGGAVDEADADAVAAALREAQEETGLDPSGVCVLMTLPPLYLPQRRPAPGRGFVVTPVLAWWRTPSDVRPGDPREVASVHQVPLDELRDPANRLQVQHPSGFVGPAFRVGPLLVWGFTAGLLDRLMLLAGWERPWRRQPAEDLPEHLLRLSS